jgi:glutaredoxin 3
MSQVVIYSSTFCPYCVRAKMLLDKKKISYTEKNLDRDRALRAEMTQKSGGRTSVPQIWIGERHVGGCDELFALERAGQLDDMLAN